MMFTSTVRYFSPDKKRITTNSKNKRVGSTTTNDRVARVGGELSSATPSVKTNDYSSPWLRQSKQTLKQVKSALDIVIAKE